MQLRQQGSSGSAPGVSPASDALDQLKQAHLRLLAEIANMDAVTRGSRPDADRYSAARWRISQASLIRRRLSLTIRVSLLSTADPQEKATLKALQEAELQSAMRSRAHVGKWSSDKIFRDWAGYCEASRMLRWHMDAHITLERTKLYPMLERRVLTPAA
jgi:hypothetical protein